MKINYASQYQTWLATSNCLTGLVLIDARSNLSGPWILWVSTPVFWLSNLDHLSVPLSRQDKREVSPNLQTFQFTKEWHQIITGTLPMSFKLHFEIFEGSTREISTWKYPQGFHRERRRKYPHRKFPFISPEFPQGNHEEISAGMIPWNSPINPRGNLGDVDGSPAGGEFQDGCQIWCLLEKCL